MSQSRARNRRKMQSNGRGPFEGARDLSHMKGGDKQRQRELAKQQLQQNQVVCRCGRRMEDEAVELIGTWVGTGPGPLAGQDLACAVRQSFCRADCIEALKALKDGMSFQTQVPTPMGVVLLEGVATVACRRSLPAVTWLEAENGLIQ